jgi:hypothetical protein
MASKVKIIDIAKEGTLLPPPKGTCPACAVKHDPEMPHNQQSLYYQYHFYNKHGRWPTWKDAMLHCTDEIKAFWIEELGKHGINVNESEE